MNPLDSIVAVLLVVLCAHAGILVVVLVRGIIPQRHHRERTTALSAGLAALVGELLALRGLITPTSPVWIAGLLGVGLLLGFVSRGSWKEHPVGRASFHAVIAPPIVFAFILALTLRSG